MASLISYEQRTDSVRTEHGALNIQYIKCSPPSRLAPKGTVILLHDYFRTNYQFRFVIDLFAMGGYVTVAPDLLNLTGKSNGSSTFKTIASHLIKFLSKSYPDTSLHLIGCGFGAQIASEIYVRCPGMVASLICSNGITETEVQHVMNLIKSSSPDDVFKAFEADLEIRRGRNELLSRFDVEEYADAYSQFATIFEMQNLFQLRTRPSTETQTDSTSFVSSHPEQQPEEWTITILSILNQQSVRPSTRRARL